MTERGVTCSRWSTVQLGCRDVTRRGVHAGLPAAAGGALAPLQAHDLAFEWAALHGEFGDVEVAAVAQHGEHDPTEAVSDRHHRHLVAAARSQLGEVWLEGVVGTARLVRRFAEHRAQLGGAALGDPAVGVAVA